MRLGRFWSLSTLQQLPYLSSWRGMDGAAASFQLTSPLWRGCSAVIHSTAGAPAALHVLYIRCAQVASDVMPYERIFAVQPRFGL
jgi:hypothetical protein